MEIRPQEQRAVAMVDRLWDSVGAAMDSRTEPWGVKELKELTGITKELMALQSLLEGGAPREEAQIRIVLPEEAERWGE